MITPLLAGLAIGAVLALIGFAWGRWRERRLNVNQRRQLARTLAIEGWDVVHPRNVVSPTTPLLLDTGLNRAAAAVPDDAPWTRELQAAVDRYAEACSREHPDVRFAHRDAVNDLARHVDRSLFTTGG